MQQGIKSKPVNLGLTKIVAALLPDQLYIPEMMIFHNGSFWECIKEHKSDGKFIEENWMKVSESSAYLLLDHPELGSIQYYPDGYPIPEGMLLANTIHQRDGNELLYEYYLKNKPELIIDENSFRTPAVNSATESYRSSVIYKKGDEIVVKPSSYDTLTILDDSMPNHMGKYVYYRTTTYCKRFDVKLRAKKDNPGDPTINTANWEPAIYDQLIEWGSNAYGQYWLYANGDMRVLCTTQISGQVANSAISTVVNYPITFYSISYISTPKIIRPDGTDYFGSWSGLTGNLYNTTPLTSLSKVNHWCIFTGTAYVNGKVVTETFGKWYNF